MNEKESPDSKYIWRIRGTPKNRPGMKRFEVETSNSTKLIV